MMHYNKLGLTLSVIIACAFPSNTYGAWDIAPSVEVESSYDSNVRLLNEGEFDALVSTLRGQLRVKKATESSNVSAIAGLSFLNYSLTDRLKNQDNQFALIDANKKTERLRLSFLGSYRRDQVLRRSRIIPLTEDGSSETPLDNSSLPDTGSADFDIDPDLDKASSEEEVRREKILLRPSLNWQVTERTGTRLSVNYSDTKYGKNAISVGLRDSHISGAEFTTRRTITARDALSFSVTASLFEPDQGTNAQNYELRAIWNHQYSERSRIEVQVGARRTERDSTNTSNETGFLFRISGNRRYELAGLNAMIERSIYPSSYGQLVETDRIRFNWNRPISNRMALRLGIAAYKTDIASGSGRTSDFLSVHPALSYKLAPAWSVRLSYDYRWIDRKDDNPSAVGTASGSTVSIAISYRPPRSI